MKRDGFDVVLDEILAADAETEMAEEGGGRRSKFFPGPPVINIRAA